MRIDIDKYRQYAPVVLRYGMGLLLLWFGLKNITDPSYLSGYLPKYVPTLLGVSKLTFMFYNGIFEVILSGLLLLGYYTRLVSFIIFLHIIGIGINLGYNDVAIRDIGLSISALSIFIHGPDKYCMDLKKNKKRGNK